MFRTIALILFLICQVTLLSAAEIEELKIVLLTQQQEIPASLSNLDPVLDDEGVQGARLAILDNNTTGQFIRQRFVLDEKIAPVGSDLLEMFKQIVSDGYQHIIVDISAVELAKVSSQVSLKNIHLYNISAVDEVLRGKACHSNILHLIPDRAMRADALGQYLLKKRWKKLFLVVGRSEEDQLYAAALRRAAKKFGLKIVQEKSWMHTYDARRTAQSDVPLFTRGEEYDVLVVADEQGLFGEYLEYRSWFPRPVAGTQGLVPTSWHRTHEQWGAVQLQNRFRKQAGRWMTEVDYAAWLAVRAIGESATRSHSVEFKKIRDFMLSEAFAMAGFKGKKLSFRSWDRQLRQPILLAAARSMVAVAPLPEFLHPKSTMDTLGYDKPESRCNLNSK